MKRASIALLSVVLAAAAAPAGEPARFALEEDQVLLTYQAALGRQQLSGVSRALAGGVEELAGGALRVTASVPVSSFSSGNRALDAIFARALQADQFPVIEFEGQAAPAKRSGQFTTALEGTLSLRGVSQHVAAQVRVLRDGKTLFVKTTFPVDLAAFGIGSPEIAGIAVSQKIQIELHALMRPGQATAFAQGPGAPRG